MRFALNVVPCTFLTDGFTAMPHADYLRLEERLVNKHEPSIKSPACWQAFSQRTAWFFGCRSRTLPNPCSSLFVDVRWLEALVLKLSGKHKGVWSVRGPKSVAAYGRTKH